MAFCPVVGCCILHLWFPLTVPASLRTLEKDTVCPSSWPSIWSSMLSLGTPGQVAESEYLWLSDQMEPECSVADSATNEKSVGLGWSQLLVWLRCSFCSWSQRGYFTCANHLGFLLMHSGSCRQENNWLHQRGDHSGHFQTRDVTQSTTCKEHGHFALRGPPRFSPRFPVFYSLKLDADY